MRALLPERPGLAGAFPGRLLAIAAAALAVRAGFLLLEPRVELAGDEPTWLALAPPPFSPLRSPILFYPPAYPYFIGAVRSALGGLRAVEWAQVVLSALLPIAIGRMGAFLFSARAGLLAAGIAALYPELVWFSAHFWSETLFLSLLFWAFERTFAADHAEGRVASFLGGLVWGLASLTRETALYFAPVVAAWLARRGSGARAAARARGGVFLLTVVLTVAPWTWRNWRVFHAFIPVSTFGAHALWQGNTRLDVDEFYRQTDSVPGAVAQFDLARDRARAAILDRQPWWIFEKIAHELPLLWAPETHLSVLLDNHAYGPLRPATAALARAACIVPYLVVLALALPGLAGLRFERGPALVVLFLLYYNALHVFAYGQDRFRLPMMPFLFLVAGYALTDLRKGSGPPFGRGRLCLLGALAVGFAALVLRGFFG